MVCYLIILDGTVFRLLPSFLYIIMHYKGCYAMHGLPQHVVLYVWHPRMYYCSHRERRAPRMKCINRDWHSECTCMEYGFMTAYERELRLGKMQLWKDTPSNNYPGLVCKCLGFVLWIHMLHYGGWRGTDQIYCFLKSSVTFWIIFMTLTTLSTVLTRIRFKVCSSVHCCTTIAHKWPF